MSEGSSLKAVQVSRLKSRIAELEEQNTVLTADKDLLSKQLSELQQGFDSSVSELNQLKLTHRQQLAILRDEAVQLKTQLSDAHAAAAEGRHHVEAARAETHALLTAREGGSSALRAKVSKLEGQLVTKTKEVVTLSRKLGAADSLADALEQELKDLQMTVSKVIDRMQAQESGLKQQERRLLEVTKVGEQLADQLQGKTAALKATQQHVKDLQQRQHTADEAHAASLALLQQQLRDSQQQIQQVSTDSASMQETLKQQLADGSAEVAMLTAEQQKMTDFNNVIKKQLQEAEGKLVAHLAAAAEQQQELEVERNTAVLGLVCMHQRLVSVHRRATAVVKAAAAVAAAAQQEAASEANEAAAAVAAAAAAQDATAAAQAAALESARAAAEAEAAMAAAVKAEAAAKADAVVSRAEAAQVKKALSVAVADADRALEEATAANIEAEAARAQMCKAQSAADQAKAEAAASAAASPLAAAVPAVCKSGQIGSATAAIPPHGITAGTADLLVQSGPAAAAAAVLGTPGIAQYQQQQHQQLTQHAIAAAGTKRSWAFTGPTDATGQPATARQRISASSTMQPQQQMHLQIPSSEPAAVAPKEGFAPQGWGTILPQQQHKPLLQQGTTGIGVSYGTAAAAAAATGPAGVMTSDVAAASNSTARQQQPLQPQQQQQVRLPMLKVPPRSAVRPSGPCSVLGNTCFTTTMQPPQQWQQARLGGPQAKGPSSSGPGPAAAAYRSLGAAVASKPSRPAPASAAVINAAAVDSACTAHNASQIGDHVRPEQQAAVVGLQPGPDNQAAGAALPGTDTHVQAAGAVSDKHNREEQQAGQSVGANAAVPGGGAGEQGLGPSTVPDGSIMASDVSPAEPSSWTGGVTSASAAAVDVVGDGGGGTAALAAETPAADTALQPVASHSCAAPRLKAEGSADVATARDAGQQQTGSLITAAAPAAAAARATSAMGMLFCALADDSDIEDESSSQQSARGVL